MYTWNRFPRYFPNLWWPGKEPQYSGYASWSISQHGIGFAASPSFECEAKHMKLPEKNRKNYRSLGKVVVFKWSHLGFFRKLVGFMASDLGDCALQLRPWSQLFLGCKWGYHSVNEVTSWLVIGKGLELCTLKELVWFNMDQYDFMTSGVIFKMFWWLVTLGKLPELWKVRRLEKLR